jgi:hypothetical protein
MSIKLGKCIIKLVGGRMMNKEEILARSRRENKDEREIMVRDQSMRWTLITMAVLAVIFAFIRDSRGQTVMDLSVVVCGSCSATFIYRFIKTKRRDCLILGILSIAVAIFALIRFIMGY